MAPFDFSSIAATPWFQAWQRAAADSMAAAARDPRLIHLGTGLMRSSLLWLRAWQTFGDAMQSHIWLERM
jgi:hypothetical protein